MFSFSVPRIHDDALQFDISPGQCVFILGANGTGKSSLMHHLYLPHQPKAKRILAHRQTWLQSSAPDLSAQQRIQTIQNIKIRDAIPDARYRDDYSSARASIALYDLADEENVRARNIAAAIDKGDLSQATSLSAREAPVATINRLLRLSNLSIQLEMGSNDAFTVKKGTSEPYGIVELSDGERNAILVSATVLTGKSGTLFIIDEPERHLHRSIIAPLLSNLFTDRPDCAFLISTHDVSLAAENGSARTILVRGCTYHAGQANAWDADFLCASAQIENDVKREILGSRRRMLFIEGDAQSLDLPLYSIIFPDVSVIQKGTCKEVEQVVLGIRATDNLHWIQAYGLVDNDARGVEDIARLREHGIFVLDMHSVESVYYCIEIQEMLARRHASVTGSSAEDALKRAKEKSLQELERHADRLSERRVERALRDRILATLPKRSDIAARRPIEIRVDVAQAVAAELSLFRMHIQNQNLASLIARYPIRETRTLKIIAEELGFRDRAQYERATRKMLLDDPQALAAVRALFGDLWATIENGTG